MEKVQAERGVDRILIFYDYYRSEATHRPHVLHLLPPNAEWWEGLAARPRPTHGIPSFRMPWPRFHRN